jgi:hypothetical protein
MIHLTAGPPRRLRKVTATFLPVSVAPQSRPSASMPRGDFVDLGGLRLVRVHAPGRYSGPYLVQDVAHKLCLDAMKKHDGSTTSPIS